MVFQTCFFLSPRNLGGKRFNWTDARSFQLGWFKNHQLVLLLVSGSVSNVSSFTTPFFRPKTSSPIKGPPWSQGLPRMVPRFAPLQFAFCSVLGPSSVTPELLASVIDKIAAVASVTVLLFFKDLFWWDFMTRSSFFLVFFVGGRFFVGFNWGKLYIYVYYIHIYLCGYKFRYIYIYLYIYICVHFLVWFHIIFEEHHPASQSWQNHNKKKGLLIPPCHINIRVERTPWPRPVFRHFFTRTNQFLFDLLSIDPIQNVGTYGYRFWRFLRIPGFWALVDMLDESFSSPPGLLKRSWRQMWIEACFTQMFFSASIFHLFFVITPDGHKTKHAENYVQINMWTMDHEEAWILVADVWMFATFCGTSKKTTNLCLFRHCLTLFSATCPDLAKVNEIDTWIWFGVNVLLYPWDWYIYRSMNGWCFMVNSYPSLPKSSKYLVNRCLEPLNVFSGVVWGSKHLLTRYLED